MSRCPWCELDNNAPLLYNWDVWININRHYLECYYGKNKNEHIKYPIKYCPMCGKKF
jgi:hypothetical protein